MANPFAHIELNTNDLPKAKKFYRALFDWKLADMPMVPYTMIDVGGGTGGGMQTKPLPEAPTAWLPYVQVDDVKKTLKKAEKAGAAIVMEYTPIDAMGAIGVFIDPAGAMLGLWEMGAAATTSAAEKPAQAKKAAAKPARAKKAAAKPLARKKAPAKPVAAKKVPAKAPPTKQKRAKQKTKKK